MVSANTQVPVILGIDVEPDARLTDPRRPQPWRGFEQLYPFISELRSQLATRSGRQPQFSWLFRLDPQISETYGDPTWPLQHYEREVTALLAAGDEVGVHTHVFRRAATRATWIVDEANEEWVNHCVTSSFRAFESFFHRTSRIHKFGDRWLSNAGLATLEELGARVDLTPEPGVRSPLGTRDEAHTAAPPDCTHIPRHAYRPSRADFRTPDPHGGGRLWLLPLSTWPVPWYIQFPRRMYHRLRWRRSGPTPGDESSRAMVTVRPVFRQYLFRLLVDRLLASPDSTHLALAFRSSDGTAPAQLRRIAANTTALLSHPLADRLRFMGPEAALHVLGHAPADR